MNQIIEAIDLIPTQPLPATRRLNALRGQLKDNFIPTVAEAAIMSNNTDPAHQKQLMTILNKYVMDAFMEEGHRVYTRINELHQMLLRVLESENIHLSAKKVLAPCMTKVVSGVAYQPEEWVQWVERMSNQGKGYGMWVYWQALLDKAIDEWKMLESLKMAYLHTFYMATEVLKEIRDLQGPTNAVYVHGIVKQIVCYLVQFTNQHGNSQHHQAIVKILLCQELSVYLATTLKFQEKILGMGSNPYPLAMIYGSDLPDKSKSKVNQLKSKALTTLRLILSITDKNFNLTCSPHPLMKELFTLADTLITDLITLSYPSNMELVRRDVDSSNILPAMFGVLATIVEFKDLKASFQRMTIEQLLRLTVAYLHPSTEEDEVEASLPEEHFSMLYFICQGKWLDEDKESSIEDLLLGQTCLRRGVSDFINSMNKAVEGFHSIMLQLCFYWIGLEMEARRQVAPFNWQDLAQKFSLSQQFGKLNFSFIGILTCTCVLLDKCWEGTQERNWRISTLLQTIDLSLLDCRQIQILYLLLSLHSGYFVVGNTYDAHSRIFERAVRFCQQPKLAYFCGNFLNNIFNHSSGSYRLSHLILEEILAVLGDTVSTNLVEVTLRALKHRRVVQDCINLEWVFRAINRVNQAIRNRLNNPVVHFTLVARLLTLQSKCLMVGGEQISTFERHSYPNFDLHKQQYIEATSDILHPRLVNYVKDLADKAEDLETEEIEVIKEMVRVCYLLLEQEMIEGGYDIIVDLTLKIVSSPIPNDRSLAKCMHQIIYRIIAMRMWSLNEPQMQTIVSWFKKIHHASEIELNQVCLMVQLILSNISPHHESSLVPMLRSLVRSLSVKLVMCLIGEQAFMEAMQGDQQDDFSHISALNFEIRLEDKKYHPITIVRLLGVALLWPDTEWGYLQKITPLLMHQTTTQLSSYDLTVHALSIRRLLHSNCTPIALRLIHFTTELLFYNMRHTQQPRHDTQQAADIFQMGIGLKSSLSECDGFVQFGEMVEGALRGEWQCLRLNPNIPQFDLGEYIRNDTRLMQLVKEVSSTRLVNQQPRTIFRIKRQ